MDSTHKIHTHHAASVNVKMYTRDEEVEKRLLRGRVLLDSDENSLLFAQNDPRGPRSAEVFRSAHGRLVRRPDGRYTLTFSAMEGDEKQLRMKLLAEIRENVDKIEDDMKRQLQKQKEAEIKAFGKKEEKKTPKQQEINGK